MNRLQAIGHSWGKTPNRNDDFVYYKHISATSLLGVLGDFTGDSPQGTNKALVDALDTFVTERIDTWRDNLVDARNIVKLASNHINGWLLERPGKKAQTTLVVTVYDAYNGQLYYVTAGDSGLAVVTPKTLTFLARGDTSGARDASAHLPVANANFTTGRSEVAADAVVFAYSDGLWENTAHFLKTDQHRQFLHRIFYADNLRTIDQRLHDELIPRSSSKDDLSVLIIKEEAMNNDHDTGTNLAGLPEEHLEALVKSQVLAALEEHGSTQAGASGLERELTAALQQSAENMDGIYEKVRNDIRTAAEKHLEGYRTRFNDLLRQAQKQDGQLETQMRQHIAAIDSKLARLKTDFGTSNQSSRQDMLRFDAELNELKQTLDEQWREIQTIAGQAGTSAENPHEPAGSQQSQLSSGTVNEQLRALEVRINKHDELKRKVDGISRQLEALNRKATKTAKNDHAEPPLLQVFKDPKSVMAVTLFSVAMIVLGLLLGHLVSGPGEKTAVETKPPLTANAKPGADNQADEPENAVETLVADPGTTTADVTSSNPGSNEVKTGPRPYQPGPAPVKPDNAEKAIAWIFGHEGSFNTEIDSIKNGLANNRGFIKTSGGKYNKISLPSPIGPFNELYLRKKNYKSDTLLTWVNTFVNGSQPVSDYNAKALWLQVQLNVTNRDGLLGSGSKRTLIAFINARSELYDYLKNNPSLDGQFTTPDSKLRRLIKEGFNIDEKAFGLQLAGLTNELQRLMQQQPEAPLPLKVDLHEAGQSNQVWFRTRVDTGTSTAPTPIRTYLNANKGKNSGFDYDSALLAVWLAGRLDVAETDGNNQSALDALSRWTTLKDRPDAFFDQLKTVWGF